MYNAVPKETALLRGQRYYKKTRLGTDYTDYTDKFVKISVKSAQSAPNQSIVCIFAYTF